MRAVLIILALSFASPAAWHLGRVLLGENAGAGDPQREKTVRTETDWNDYMWPTNAGRIRTSSFAEFRSNHFHAGIDVSTGNRTGFDMYASRSGWLHSITFQPYGYGWLLVLRHPDGYYTCYAHLKGFPKKVIEAYHAKLASLDRSFGRVEWAKGEVPVQKGELVAYTGDTGAGPAHIHFEVRDADFNPVNPEIGAKLRTRDTIAPEFRQICFMPLDARSSVNGKSAPLLLDASRRDSKGYLIAAKPVLSGRVGVLVRAQDRAQDAQDAPTPHALLLSLDAKPFFESRFDRVQDDHSWHIRIDRDHWLMKAKKGEFRKLFREEGNTLSVYIDHGNCDGELSVESAPAGERRLRIDAKDISGNASSLRIAVVIAPERSPELRFKDGALTVSLPDARGAAALALFADAGKGRWREVRRWKTPESGEAQLYETSGTRSTWKAAALSADGVELSAAFASNLWDGGDARISTTMETRFDEIALTVAGRRPFDGKPYVTVTQGRETRQAEVFWEGPGRVRAVLKAWQGFAGDAVIRTSASIGGVAAEAEERINMTLVSTESGGSVKSGDGKCVIDFGPRDVYRSMLVALRGSDDASGRACYEAAPDDVPLAGKPVVRVRSATEESNACFIKAHNSFAHLRFDRRGEAGRGAAAGAFGRLLGRYCLLADAAGPEISVSPGRGGLEIRITDSLSGVDPESIRVRAGGIALPLEFSEAGRAYLLPRSIARAVKDKTVLVEASDLMGNTTRRQASAGR